MTAEKNSPRRKSVAHDRAITALLCFAGLLTLGMIAGSADLPKAKHGINDFTQLYVGAKLAGSPDLYSVDANLRLQREFASPERISVLYARLPFYAYLLKPMAMFSYRAAYFGFEAASLIAILLLIWLLEGRMKETLVLASFSIPAVVSLLNGQDATFVALAYAGFYLLSERGRSLPAGLLLSLCLIKYHFFPLTALALLLRKEWSVLRGALLGGAALAVLSFAGGGAHWPTAYWAILKIPADAPWKMPNIHGMVTGLGQSSLLEAALSALVLGLFVMVARRTKERALVYSLALAGGVLLSVHAYTQDCLLLLVALGILAYTPGTIGVRRWLEVSVTPFPYMLLSSVRWGAAGIVLVLIAALAWGAFRTPFPIASSPDQPLAADHI